MRDRGLYEKFRVFRADGQSASGRKHHKCAYFVLDMDHDPHAVAAVMAYAKSCAEQYPFLAADLMVLYGPGGAQESAAGFAPRGLGDPLARRIIAGLDDPELVDYETLKKRQADGDDS